MLRSVLDLGEVQVSEIMTHRTNTATIDANLPAEKAVKAILKSPYTRIPIWTNAPDNIVGIIHAKALLQEIHQRKGNIETLKAIEIGSDFLESERSYDIVLIAQFDNQEDLKIYAQHENHLPVVKIMRSLCSSSVVVDYKI